MSRSATALLVLTLAACGSEPTSLDAGALSLAKGGPGPTVTAADPSWGNPGATGKEVVIIGSGFDDGTVAAWLRSDGGASQVTVRQTTFLSPSQLRATIDIAGDAEMVFYDIAVTTRGGRKGIGIERFEVTQADNLGVGGPAWAANDDGYIVGATNAGEPWIWSPVTGQAEFLGFQGGAIGINATATVVTGNTRAVNLSDADAVAYERSGSGGWTRVMLPQLGLGSVARAAADSSGTVLAIGWVITGGNKRQKTSETTLWRRTPTGSWTRHPRSGCGGEDVNPLGWSVGALVLCKSDGGPRIALGTLPGATGGIAFGISPDGRYIAGILNGVGAVYWAETAPDVWTPVQLSSCGWAEDVNDAGFVAGNGVCGERARAWRVSGTSVLREMTLGGLGSRNGPASPRGLNNAPQPTIVGRADDNGNAQWAAKWSLFDTGTLEASR